MGILDPVHFSAMFVKIFNMETFLITTGIVVAILLFVWWLYRRIRQSICCGTCGCNLVSDKEKKRMLARRAKRLQRKNGKCKSCPAKRP